MSLIAHYAFEDNLNDETDNHYNGTVNGSISYVTGGKVGKALSKAAGQNGFHTPVGVAADTGNKPYCTIDLYIKPSDLTDTYNCIWRTAEGWGSYYLYVMSDGRIWGSIYSGQFSTDAGIIKAGTWYRITVVWDLANHTATLYVDGVSKHSEAMGGNTPWGIAQGFNFGLDAWSTQDLAGLFDEVKIYNSVEVPPAPPAPPVAAFSGSPLSGNVPLTVQFTDESTNDPTSWLWDFGDEGSSEEQSPEHKYESVGTYTVKLTATNDGGSDDEEKPDYITVSGAPSAGSPNLCDRFVRTGWHCFNKQFIKHRVRGEVPWRDPHGNLYRG